MTRQIFYKLAIMAVLTMPLQVNCVPNSPCPMNFYYEFDGNEWLGVVKIYPQIYNRLRSDHITMNLTLVINRHIPNVQNFRLLQLYKTLAETYRDIAFRRPIIYRINFPFRNDFPELLRMHVNGVRVCTNPMIYFIKSRIEQQYTFYLPTITDEEPEMLDYELVDFENGPEPAITNPILEVPKVIAQRVDKNEPHRKLNPRWKNRLQATDSQCGTYDEELKYTQLISGGEKITPGTWPWLVAIFRKDSKASNLVFQCTGSLITNRLVLTAAHCFKSDYKMDHTTAAKNIILAFGRHDIRDWTEKNMIMSDVDEIILHPDYLKDRESTIFDADIAMLVTKDFIAYTSMIKPICLWPASIDKSYSVIGTNGTLVGWGQPYENTDENVPRRLTLPIVRNQSCFPTEKSHTGRTFCAGTERRGYAPCNGDSGSAFAIHANGAWFMRGLVSAALGDPILNRCELNTFAIFTDIVHYRSWIDSHM